MAIGIAGQMTGMTVLSLPGEFIDLICGRAGPGHSGDPLSQSAV
jgi:hypothetical protein